MDDEIVEKYDSKLNLNSRRICQRTFGPKKGYLNCPKCPPGRKPHKNRDCLRLHLTKKHPEVQKGTIHKLRHLHFEIFDPPSPSVT